MTASLALLLALSLPAPAAPQEPTPDVDSILASLAAEYGTRARAYESLARRVDKAVSRALDEGEWGAGQPLREHPVQLLVDELEAQARARAKAHERRNPERQAALLERYPWMPEVEGPHPMDEALAFLDARWDGYAFEAPYTDDLTPVVFNAHDLFGDSQGFAFRFSISEQLHSVGDMPFICSPTNKLYGAQFHGQDLDVCEYNEPYHGAAATIMEAFQAESVYLAGTRRSSVSSCERWPPRTSPTRPR